MKSATSSKKLRPCSIPSCSRRIPADQLMCSTHWDMVPTTLQAEIRYRWLEVKGEKTTSGMVTKTKREYVALITKAITHVQQQEAIGT